MTLKLTKAQAAAVKAVQARIAEKTQAITDARDTATLKAAISVMFFTLKEAGDVVTRAEAEANRLASSKLEVAA